ncbi:NAD(P)H-dependent oxidoreductase [Hydrogenophaga pseudoflava]|uniref:Homoserine dehydrogenase n=1 Tax=Hydrogenophaga pseudoflava TaxID=47421 RepID=A0A4V1ABT6_HYDPS|nr:Gfo/Idh/MocA family oxidoreductase [Hydrogenophaga pseudoflava]QBM29093.1 homoserine dehydrogenase [Hydrogenophaga pseudoflava]
MIIIDSALKKRQAENNPVRVAMVGAGFMGRGVALQIIQSTPGMKLVAVSNRNIEQARRAYNEANVQDLVVVETVAQLEDAIAQDRYAVTDDAFLLCQAEGIDAIIEVTGAVEFSAQVVFKAIEHRKHVIMMNAELDGTVGPILKVYADKAGVVLTNVDGDQPGVIMNLYRFVKGIGVKPVLCGNIKGLHDPYRNPTTQEGFAKKWGQNPAMVTSFADGTKISYEQAIVANATGMRVAQRGMFGPTVEAGAPITEAVNWYPLEELLQGPGIVDYVVGAAPNPGVFVLGTHDHPQQKHYLNLYKLGEGPLYCFYTPYHLCHFEVPNTVARAVLFSDAAIAPIAGPCVDVVATAKIDLKAGQLIDGIGGYMTYGLAENSQVVNQGRLLPMGLAEGCRLKRDVPKDQVLCMDDVTVPEGRLSDQLRAEQNAYFSN